MATRTIATLGSKLSIRNAEKVEFRVKEITYESPVKVFSKLVNEYNYVYLLESATGPEKLAEFSFIGFDPKMVIRVKDGKAEIIGENRDVVKTSNPLQIVREELNSRVIQREYPRFIGGAVGMFPTML